MKSFEEQKAFFHEHASALRDAVTLEGVAGAQAFVAGFEPRERRVLCAFARQKLFLGDEPVELDTYLAFAKMGIEECVAQAESESDDEQRARRIDTANVISYNLAADLADCWNDEHEREARHFEAGLDAALDCIRWREELKKPPFPHSIAWWARGMHELSLGRAAQARASFAKSSEYALAAAEGAEDGFGVVLGRGYAAIAAAADGDPSAEASYRAAIAVFEAQLGDEDKRDDAQFGLEQLETVRTRYWSA